MRPSFAEKIQHNRQALAELKRLRPLRQRLTDFSTWPDDQIFRRDPFGRELHRFLNYARTYRLLPEGDWLEGGCLLLGLALQVWLGDRARMEAVFFPGTRNTPQHVVTRVGRAYLDGDGAFWPEELHFKCCEIERYPDCQLRPVSASDCEAVGITAWHDRVPLLARRLEEHFSTPERRPLVEAFWQRVA